MNEQQADALIDELHELNKTLKAISSSPERFTEMKINSNELSKGIGEAFTSVQKELEEHSSTNH